jgi:hypothetical protein
VLVYAVVDDALSPDFPLGVELEVFIRREDAERSADFAASARFAVLLHTAGQSLVNDSK